MTTPSFFDDLRAGFAFVANRAQHVLLHVDHLAAYADRLPAVTPYPDLDNAHHFIGTPEETAAYVLALDAINFGSGFEPALVADGLSLREDSIYYTIAGGLKDHFHAAGALTAAQLARLSVADVAPILGLGRGATSDMFAKLCAERLNEIGTFIGKHYNGRFLNFVDAADGSVEPFVQALAALPGFVDVHMYDGRAIGFYKRAQIAAADMQLAFRHFGRTVFRDIDRLTLFADNAVPHVLRVDGLLDYDAGLANAIASETHIPSGSPREVELRACAAHAVEIMAARRKLPAMEIDHRLWARSREARYNAGPPHRTLSAFY